MEYWDSSQGQVMIDPITEAVEDLLGFEGMSASDFIDILAEYGFMIVPIEDPTNLRFGIED